MSELIRPSLRDENRVLALGYLKASSQRDTLLTHFGSPKLQIKKSIFVNYVPFVAEKNYVPFVAEIAALPQDIFATVR